MSAWIVSKKHIDLIVKALTEGDRGGAIRPRRYPPDYLGQLLVTENVASVRYRYPRSKPGEEPGGPAAGYYLRPYLYADPRYRPSPAELCKAIDCLEYQSCEHPGWSTSQAKNLLGRVIAAVRKKVSEAERYYREAADSAITYHLKYQWPEYDAAPWGLDEESVALLYARLHGMAEAPRGVLSDWLIEQGLIEEPLGAA